MSAEITDLSAEYYGFGSYVDRQRWLTYFRQLELLLASEPKRVLEVGVGPGIVKAVLKDRGVDVVTVDVNDSLGADYVADLRSLPAAVSEASWDWVLCSRVLHHIPKSELTSVLAAMASLNATKTLVTVPREDLSVQLTVRRTAGGVKNVRASGGSRIKNALRRTSVIKSPGSGLWMLNGLHGLTSDEFADLLRKSFEIVDDFILDDDPAHVFFVLRPA